MKPFTISDDLFDHSKFRGMSRWFSPRVLTHILRNVIISSIFGQYADKRLLHASLDPLEIARLKISCGTDNGICKKSDGSIWVDYVADLGDGFDSTYAIAYLIGQKSIEVEGVQLPRAGCLVMGGDQVYPEANRDDYRYRMRMPYEAAFPRTDKVGAEHPPVFLIPGNHDWYDGLELFLGLFCRGIDTFLGSWVARQSRSYFAAHLGNDWWVWGFDSQLGETIDIPQKNYFTEVAKSQMKVGSKVILCAPAPTWRMADSVRNAREERAHFERGMDFIANVLANECKDAKIVLVLAGDLHHYTRYIAQPSGVSFIGAGGGGAFLHPTHGIPDQIDLTWMTSVQHLKLAESFDKNQNKTEACYPTRAESRKLALGNWNFLLKNFEFCLTLGGVYALGALLLLWWRGYGEQVAGSSFFERVLTQLISIATTPMFLLVSAAFFWILFKYADLKPRHRRILGPVHALAHLAILLLGTSLVTVTAYPLLSYPYAGDTLYFVAICLGLIVAGGVGGIVWGFYLLISSYWLEGHANDAFSAMRLDSFRHFLRMKIEGSKLTIYPTGIDESPERRDWQKNPNHKEWDQDTPYFVPKKPLGQIFIEKPIVVDADQIKPIEGAKFS